MGDPIPRSRVSAAVTALVGGVKVFKRKEKLCALVVGSELAWSCRRCEGTFFEQRSMSALPPKADMLGVEIDIR